MAARRSDWAIAMMWTGQEQDESRIVSFESAQHESKWADR